MPFPPASSLARLIEAPVRPGTVEWIGVRPARRAAMRSEDAAELRAGHGLVGDRYGNPGGARQVTLIEAESLATIASHLGRDLVRADELRRNVVVRGLNLVALKGRRFRIGAALLEASGECHPCSRMEEILGSGGYNAVRGLGGITARVIAGAVIRIGDAVAPTP
ncbi:MAG TPA: MOSC domain-containing protein [Caldimonas sp.]|jgi:MOSC domain-containing protein YiiM|nr:MOSC domain-containing protein [Caldimonas sp.]HEV7575792.1 MOSC domain-containing protein [Caldimonas sp.]